MSPDFFKNILNSPSTKKLKKCQTMEGRLRMRTWYGIDAVIEIKNRSFHKAGLAEIGVILVSIHAGGGNAGLFKSKKDGC